MERDPLFREFDKFLLCFRSLWDAQEMASRKLKMIGMGVDKIDWSGRFEVINMMLLFSEIIVWMPIDCFYYDSAHCWMLPQE